MRLLICGVFWGKKLPNVYLLFTISPIVSNPTSLQFVQVHFFNSFKLFVIAENGHDRIDGNYQALSTYLGYMEKFLVRNNRKFKHDSTPKKKTTTFPIFTQPAQKYCSYNHLIPFTLHCGQMVDSLSGQETQRFDFRSDEGGHAWVH